MASKYRSNEALEISGIQARQGVTGHNVRYVLIFSIIGIVSAFALVAAIWLPVPSPQ